MSYNISTKLLNTEQPHELSHFSGFVHMGRIVLCPHLPKHLVINGYNNSVFYKAFLLWNKFDLVLFIPASVCLCYDLVVQQVITETWMGNRLVTRFWLRK